MKERQSNFELLRCILIIFVIVLHYNNRSIGGAMAAVLEGSTSYYYVYLMESFAICAVDTFILISGYFLINSNSRRINKAIYLLVSCIGYKILSYIFNIVAGNSVFEWQGLGRCLIPDNYFVILYIALFISSVYINYGIERMNEKQYRHMLVVITIIFCVWDNVWDIVVERLGFDVMGISTVGMYGDQHGYTIINFILLYLIAGFLRKEAKNKRRIYYVLGYFLTSLIIFECSFYIQAVWYYNNILVIIQSVCLFRVFEMTKISYNKFINKMASTVFGVFLIHTILFQYLHIPEVAQRGGIYLVIHMGTCAMGIFLICGMVVLIIGRIMRPIKRKLDSMRFMKYEIKV